VAPEEFVVDHLLDHGFRRFSGGEIVSRAGAPMYATRAGIWLEFLDHFGVVWCLVTAIGAAASVWRVSAGRDAARRREVGMLLAWAAVGSVLFTATDWRQTKHLCLLVPALALLVVPALTVTPRPVRWALRAGLVAAVAWNGVWILRLARDFAALTVTPVW
jgi:hypothetical protein